MNRLAQSPDEILANLEYHQRDYLTLEQRGNVFLTLAVTRAAYDSLHITEGEFDYERYLTNYTNLNSFREWRTLERSIEITVPAEQSVLTSIVLDTFFQYHMIANSDLRDEFLVDAWRDDILPEHDRVNLLQA
jgi:hypothetical protein